MVMYIVSVHLLLGTGMSAQLAGKRDPVFLGENEELPARERGQTDAGSLSPECVHLSLLGALLGRCGVTMEHPVVRCRRTGWICTSGYWQQMGC